MKEILYMDRKPHEVCSLLLKMRLEPNTITVMSQRAARLVFACFVEMQPG
jgi:hypothetical protein